MKHTKLVPGLVLALMLLTGCGISASSSAPRATAASTAVTGKLCQGLSSVNQTLTQLAGIGDNTTIGEVKAAQQKLESALNKLAALPGSRGDVYDSLKSVNDQLAAAVEGQPDSATVGDVGPRLQGFQSKVAQAQAAATKLASTLNCTA